MHIHLISRDIAARQRRFQALRATVLRHRSLGIRKFGDCCQLSAYKRLNCHRIISKASIRYRLNMGLNLTHKLIRDHLVSGSMQPGREIAIRIDQTLTQDATGTLVMLELEAMGLPQARTEVSVQYVDHNIIQADTKNPDDHLFLESATERFGFC